MENNIPTAEEFATEHNEARMPRGVSYQKEIGEMMIEFAKLHCEAQLKVILENAKTKTKMIPYTGVRAGGSFPVEVIDKDSINIQQSDLYGFEASIYKHWTNEFNSRRVFLSFGFIVPYNITGRNEDDPRIRLSKRIEKYFQKVD